MNDMASFEIEAGALCRDLRRIVASDGMSRQRRTRAEEFLRRLEAPASVCVLGPDAKATALIRDGLAPLAADPFVALRGYDGPLDPQSIPFDDFDIAIWCSFGFGAAEEAVWSAAPDRLMDHSVLVCLGGRKEQSDLFDTVREVAVDAPNQALGALSDMLLDRVRGGLRAAAEAARVLIDSCDLPPEAAPATPTHSPATTAQQHGPGNAAARLLLDHACDLRDTDLCADTTAQEVLSSCETVCADLSDILAAAPSGDVSEDILGDVQDAHDAIVLMGLEGGLSAATDAVTTLLQLRKELALECAA